MERDRIDVYGWMRVGAPLGLAVNMYCAQAAPTVGARLASSIIAGAIVVCLTWWCYRIERDYLNVRRIFRDGAPAPKDLT